jgi:purine nucleosidase
MQRLIIDTDPGVDDAHAILMASVYPGVKIDAILTVTGNVGLHHTTANACKILDVIGMDIPVFAGCDSALIAHKEDAASIHGTDGLGDAGFPPSPRKVEQEHASVALVRMASESPGEIVLVAIGPLTNIAVALKLDPTLPQKIQKLVVMGGAIHSRGNTRNISAEFNTFTDPEAAHIVFEAWPGMTLVSWETTMTHSFSLEVLDRWFALNTPRSEFFRRTNEKVMVFIMNVLGRKMLFGADALAMAVALEPQIVIKAEAHNVTVELSGQYTRGQTTVDWMNLSGRPASTNIIIEVDHARFLELMEMGLR